MTEQVAQKTPGNGSMLLTKPGKQHNDQQRHGEENDDFFIVKELPSSFYG